MSNTQQTFKAGQAHGHGEEKGNQLMQSARDTANSAYEKLTGQGGSTQQQKDHATGLLQQTGEQVMHRAQEAANTVKNAVGLGANNPGSTTSTTTTSTKH